MLASAEDIQAIRPRFSVEDLKPSVGVFILHCPKFEGGGIDLQSVVVAFDLNYALYRSCVVILNNLRTLPVGAVGGMPIAVADVDTVRVVSNRIGLGKLPRYALGKNRNVVGRQRLDAVNSDGRLRRKRRWSYRQQQKSRDC